MLLNISVELTNVSVMLMHMDSSLADNFFGMPHPTMVDARTA